MWAPELTGSGERQSQCSAASASGRMGMGAKNQQSLQQPRSAAIHNQLEQVKRGKGWQRGSLRDQQTLCQLYISANYEGSQGNQGKGNSAALGSHAGCLWIRRWFYMMFCVLNQTLDCAMENLWKVNFSVNCISPFLCNDVLPVKSKNQPHRNNYT